MWTFPEPAIIVLLPMENGNGIDVHCRLFEVLGVQLDTFLARMDNATQTRNLVLVELGRAICPQ